MVKKRGIVWNYYNKKVDGSQVIAFCKFCDISYIQNATRMEKHLERCPKCPEEVRRQFMQVAREKRSRAALTQGGLFTVYGNQPRQQWPKIQEMHGAMEEDRKNLESSLENPDWNNYKNENYVQDSSNYPSLENHTEEENPRIPDNSNRESSEDLNNTEESWEEMELESKVDLQQNSMNISTNATTAASSQINSQDRPMLNRKVHHVPRRLSCWPPTRGSYSPVQSKIYQEQLMERRALRKAAELELRKRTLELEKLQWEFERDKSQSEERWAHETRMMHLREDRERISIAQSRTALNMKNSST